jgi:hypothetical protein
MKRNKEKNKRPGGPNWPSPRFSLGPSRNKTRRGIHSLSSSHWRQDPTCHPHPLAELSLSCMGSPSIIHRLAPVRNPSLFSKPGPPIKPPPSPSSPSFFSLADFASSRWNSSPNSAASACSPGRIHRHRWVPAPPAPPSLFIFHRRFSLTNWLGPILLRSTPSSIVRSICRPAPLQSPSPPFSGSNRQWRSSSQGRLVLPHTVIASPLHRNHRSSPKINHLAAVLAGDDETLTLGTSSSSV